MSVNDKGDDISLLLPKDEIYRLQFPEEFKQNQAKQLSKLEDIINMEVTNFLNAPLTNSGNKYKT